MKTVPPSSRSGKLRPFPSLLRLLTGISLLGISLWAHASDWPHYRGPAMNGTTPDAFTPAGQEPRELWRVSLGTGSSGVSGTGNRAYSMGNRDGEDIVYCLDARSGNSLWEHRYPLPLDRRMFEGGPAATPTLDSNRVYTLSHQGDLFCLDAASGKKIWYRHLQQDFGGRRPEWGFSGSPTVEGKLLLLDAGGKDGSTVALDKATGELVWKTGADEAGYASPVVATLEGKRTVLVFKAKALVALQPESGTELWRAAWKTSYDVNSATPLVFGNRILVSSGYGAGCALFEVRNGAPVELWRNRHLRSHVNTPVHFGGHIFGLDGQAEPRAPLVCLNAEDGSVVWSEKGLGGSLILARDRLLLCSERGELLSLQASPAGFKTDLRLQVLQGRSWVQPSLCGTRLFLKNNQGELVCLESVQP